MAGRPSIFGQPMSAAERQKRARALAKQEGRPGYDQMITALGKAAVDLSRQSGKDSTLKRLSIDAAKILEAKGFERNRSTKAINEMMEVGGTK